MKIIRFLLLPIAVSLFYSCGKVTDEDVNWRLQSLPVVFSVVSPDNPVRVSLAHTFVQEETHDTIYHPEAKVFVCGEDKIWVELERESYEKALYTDTAHELIVQEGKTYYLRVELSGSTLSAQTTLPSDKGRIVSAECVIGGNTSTGTLNAVVELPARNKCMLMTSSRWLVGDSPFLNTERVADNYFYVADDETDVELNLFTLDAYFAKYQLASFIQDYKIYYDGDISLILGMYNGLMPAYSNIENGVGLFGSYVSDKQTIDITRL